MFGFLKKLLGGSSVAAVTPQAAQALIREGALLLDVRESAERKSGHIPGSRHVALGDLGARAGTLPKDRTIICQCASGRRSALAASRLAAAGYDVRNLRGGIQAWQAAGLPTR